ncbi:MAG: I78 family peptidase inhibitor [Pseudomonadota bacterium]
MKRIAGIALLMLSACAMDDPPQRPGPPRACNADRVQQFVGSPGSAKVVASAKRRAGARAVRRITPGMMVTMDFRMDRLNVYVNAQGRVERLTCG